MQPSGNTGSGIFPNIFLLLIIAAIIFAIFRLKQRKSTPVNSNSILTYHKQGGSRLHLVNPSNGTHKETIPFLWTLIFGGFYFIAHGIWTHAIIAFVLAIPTFGLSWLFYPFFAKSIILNYYLKMGWVEESEHQRIINQGIAPSNWLGGQQKEQKDSQSNEVVKVRCTKCNSLNDENSNYCTNCGKSLIQ
jgi:hypothetical protein